MQLNVKIQFSGHLVVHEISLHKTSLILLATRLFIEEKEERANLFLFGKTEAKDINSIMYSMIKYNFVHPVRGCAMTYSKSRRNWHGRRVRSRLSLFL